MEHLKTFCLDLFSFSFPQKQLLVLCFRFASSAAWGDMWICVYGPGFQHAKYFLLPTELHLCSPFLNTPGDKSRGMTYRTPRAGLSPCCLSPEYPGLGCRAVPEVGQKRSCSLFLAGKGLLGQPHPKMQKGKREVGVQWGSEALFLSSQQGSIWDCEPGRQRLPSSLCPTTSPPPFEVS